MWVGMGGGGFECRGMGGGSTERVGPFGGSEGGASGSGGFVDLGGSGGLVDFGGNGGRLGVWAAGSSGSTGAAGGIRRGNSSISAFGGGFGADRVAEIRRGRGATAGFSSFDSRRGRGGAAAVFSRAGSGGVRTGRAGPGDNGELRDGTGGTFRVVRSVGFTAFGLEGRGGCLASEAAGGSALSRIGRGGAASRAGNSGLPPVSALLGGGGGGCTLFGTTGELGTAGEPFVRPTGFEVNGSAGLAGVGGLTTLTPFDSRRTSGGRPLPPACAFAAFNAAIRSFSEVKTGSCSSLSAMSSIVPK